MHRYDGPSCKGKETSGDREIERAEAFTTSHQTYTSHLSISSLKKEKKDKKRNKKENSHFHKQGHTSSLRISLNDG
jgi:hypothetical protein